MKRKYTSPTLFCLSVNVGCTLTYTSVSTSEQRQTNESFSRQQQPQQRNYDIWDDEEESDDE